jgi:hypothetical protein
MGVPERVVGDLGRRWRLALGVKCQAFLCEINAAVTLFADEFEEIPELSEELCRPSVEALAGEGCWRHASSLPRWSLPMAADSGGRAESRQEVCGSQPNARRLQSVAGRCSIRVRASAQGTAALVLRIGRLEWGWCPGVCGGGGGGSTVCR